MAIDMFLKLGEIIGESEAPDHIDEINISNFHWGLSNSVDMQRPGHDGKANVGNIILTKSVCRATPVIMNMVTAGTHIPDATIVALKAGGVEKLPYFVIKLEHIAVVDQQFDGESSGLIIENITLNFSRVELMYQQQEDDGTKKGGEVLKFYDALSGESG